MTMPSDSRNCLELIEMCARDGEASPTVVEEISKHALKMKAALEMAMIFHGPEWRGRGRGAMKARWKELLIAAGMESSQWAECTCNHCGRALLCDTIRTVLGVET